MKRLDWSNEKNRWLIEVRGVSFEDVIYHLSRGGLLDILKHPNQERYSGQKVMVVNIEGYACLVPFVEDEEAIFLKTVIPSRKMTRKYLGEAEK